MLKRTLALLLSLLLLVGGAAPAMADTGTLDRALSRWLTGYPEVHFTAGLQLNALLPFNEETLAKLNAVLGHVTINAALATQGEDTDTHASVAVAGQPLFSFQETLAGGAYRFTTSLLANRTLTSEAESPLDLLGDIQPDAEVATVEASAKDAKGSVNQSDIAQAFSALDAVRELTDCYAALVSGITPITEEKRANYNIKGIGAGRWSRVARLTAEQAETLQAPIRAVLACGMDETYRAEVAQMTFDKGFVVALYQNTDKKDICLYMKGTATYPDGSTRRLLWQWAFTNNGLKRKDVFKIEIARQSGSADSRIVASTTTQEGKEDAFSITGKVETTLKRAKTTDKSTVRLDLSGQKGADQSLTCKGSVSQEIATTTGTATVKTTDTHEADLLLTPGADGATLSGTVARKQLADKTVTTDLLLTLATEAAPVTDAPQASLGSAAGDSVAEMPASSLDALAGELDTADAADEQGAYLVGQTPEGLKAYTVPQGMTTIALDQSTASQREALFQEAAQNLAGVLVLAVAALPAEDAALLADGMSEQDYAAFLSLLETR